MSTVLPAPPYFSVIFIILFDDQKQTSSRSVIPAVSFLLHHLFICAILMIASDIEIAIEMEDTEPLILPGPV